MTNSISCPVCSNICSTQAASCPKCAHPLKEVEATKEPARNGNNFICPECGSDQTSTLKMVYSQGTNSGKISMGTITGDGGFALTSGSVNSQSVLAKHVAPPRKPGISEWNIFGLVVLSFTTSLISLNIYYSGLLFLVIFVGILIVGGYCIYLSVQKKMPDYWNKVEHWKKGKICLRCSNKW